MLCYRRAFLVLNETGDAQERRPLAINVECYSDLVANRSSGSPTTGTRL